MMAQSQQKYMEIKTTFFNETYCIYNRVTKHETSKNNPHSGITANSNFLTAAT
jgi:hypothetical protein